MNPFDPETWKQEWTAFWSAHWIVGPLIALAGFVGWWFRGRMSEAQIAGLNAQISALNERLTLAKELTAAAEKAKDELEKQFMDYNAEVAAKGRNASPAKLGAAIGKFSAANTELNSLLRNDNWSIDWQQKTLDQFKSSREQESKDH
jgi:hypothetical protein